MNNRKLWMKLSVLLILTSAVPAKAGLWEKIKCWFSDDDACKKQIAVVPAIKKPETATIETQTDEIQNPTPNEMIILTDPWDNESINIRDGNDESNESEDDETTDSTSSNQLQLEIALAKAKHELEEQSEQFKANQANLQNHLEDQMRRAEEERNLTAIVSTSDKENLEKLEKRNAQLQNELGEKKKIIAEHESRLQEALEAVKKLIDEELKKNDEKVHAINLYNQDLENQVSQLKDALELQLAQYEAKEKDIAKENKNTQKAKDDFEAEIGQALADMQNYWVQEQAKWEEQHNENLHLITKLKNDLKDQEEIKYSDNIKLIHTEKLLESAVQRDAVWKEEVERLTTKVKEMSDELTTGKDKNESYKSLASDLQFELAAAKDENQSYENLIGDLRTKLGSAWFEKFLNGLGSKSLLPKLIKAQSVT